MWNWCGRINLDTQKGGLEEPVSDPAHASVRLAAAKQDHRRLADFFSRMQMPWFLTYDNVLPIREIYSQFSCFELDIGYSAQTKRRGSELLVFGPALEPPRNLILEARAA